MIYNSMFGMRSPNHRHRRRVLDRREKHMVDRHTPFCYQCNGCARCCYKHIQLNPYEIARLARNRGVDSRAFLAAYAELGGSALKRRSDNACAAQPTRALRLPPRRESIGSLRDMRL